LGLVQHLLLVYGFIRIRVTGVRVVLRTRTSCASTRVVTCSRSWAHTRHIRSGCACGRSSRLRAARSVSATTISTQRSAALRAHRARALGAAPSSHLGGIGFDLVLAALAPDGRLTWAAAALSAIGGAGSTAKSLLTEDKANRLQTSNQQSQGVKSDRPTRRRVAKRYRDRQNLYDSPLEGDGFEPSVPRGTTWVSRGAHLTSA